MTRSPKAWQRRATALATLPNEIQPDRLAPQTWNIAVVGPALGPATLLRHPVHQQQPAMGGQEHHHGVVGDFVDEYIRHVGDHDAVVGSGVHVDGIRTDAAEADYRAVLKAGNDLPRDASPARDERIGIGLHSSDELFLGLGRHLDDFGTDWV